MSFTVKAHHERYYAVFTRKTMEDALAKANELVDEGYSAVTIQDENGYHTFSQISVCSAKSLAPNSEQCVETPMGIADAETDLVGGPACR